MNMILTEFIEAIGRVADKLNIPHLLEVNIYNYFYTNHRKKKIHQMILYSQILTKIIINLYTIK